MTSRSHSWRFLVAAGLLLAAPLAGQRVAWSTVSTPEQFSNNSPAHSAVDAQGNLVIAGHFTSTFSWGGHTLTGVDGSSVFLFKISPDGDVIWSRRIGAYEGISLDTFVMDADGNVIMTFTTLLADHIQVQSALYEIPQFGQRQGMLKFSPSGAVVDVAFHAEYVAMTTLGNDLFALGYLGGLRVVRFNAELEQQWSRPLGNIALGWPRIAVNAAGDLVVAGQEGEADSIGIGDVLVPNDSWDNNEVVVLHLDTAIQPHWARTIGQSSIGMQERAYAVDLGEDGSVYVALSGDSTLVFAGVDHPDDPDVDPEVGYVCAFEANGTERWSIPMFGEDAFFRDMEVGPNGDIYAVADLLGGGSLLDQPIMGATRTFALMRANPAGSLVWTKAASNVYTSAVQLPWGLSVAQDGSCRLTGQGRDFRFECVEYPDAESSSHFVLRIDEGPVLLPTAAFTWSAEGTTVQFTNTSANADSWAWNFGDGNTSTEASPQHTYAGNGPYVVTLSAVHGECDDQVVLSVDLLTAGIEDLAGAAPAVFPIAGGVQWTVPANALGAALHDVSGRFLGSYTPGVMHRIMLPAGVYLFRAETRAGRSVLRTAVP